MVHADLPVNEVQVSVIVPVYRVEEYLCECVNSLLEQTYRNVEIILVDDASPDACPALCDAFALKDSRIRVLHKESNGGLSAARNAGLDIARGAYISFVDSDDFLSPDCIRALLNAALLHDAQMSVCRIVRVRESGGIRPQTDTDSICMNTQAALEAMLYQRPFDNSACAKLYRAELFETLRFKCGIHYEDLELTHRLIHRCARVAYTNAGAYFYRQRSGGIMNVRFDTEAMQLLSLTGRLCAFIEEAYPALRNAALCRHISACFHLYLKLPDAGFSDEREKIVHEIKRHRGTVLLDRKARGKTRLACAASYLGMRLVERLWKTANRRIKE